MKAAESIPLPPADTRVVPSDDMIEGFVVSAVAFAGDRNALVAIIQGAGFLGPLDEDGISLFLDDRPVNTPVRVVQGRHPTAGHDAVVVYVCQSLAPREAAAAPTTAGTYGAPREEFAMDHRESRVLEKCLSGDVLVRKNPGPTAVDGVDAYGTALLATKGKEVKLAAGTNAVLSSDGLVITAAIDGVPMREANGRIIVNQTVTVKQVDFKSGNIHFDGSVIVDGDVMQGFSVEATGDVHIKGGLEQAQVRAGGSVSIGGGVRRHSLVRAAGDIDARFVDSESQVESRGSVRITQNSIQSELIGDESVVVGGQLVAGRAVSWNLIEVGILGCPHGSQTVVSVERPVGALRVDALREELGLPRIVEADPASSQSSRAPSGVYRASTKRMPLHAPTQAPTQLQAPGAAPTPAPTQLPTRLPSPTTLHGGLRGPLNGSSPTRVPQRISSTRIPIGKPAGLAAARVPTDAKSIVRSKVTLAIERREREHLLSHAERELAAPSTAHGRVVAKNSVRPGVTIIIAHDSRAIDADMGGRAFFVGETGIVEALLAPAAASTPKLGK